MTWPRPTLAHIPVLGAIAFTIYANGAYAFENAGLNPRHQLAAVALAVIIDICKATFLPVAVRVWTDQRRFAAVLLALLWFPALGYSTFAGYGYLNTTRTTAHLADEGAAATRARTQAAYDRAAADLATAKTSPEWDATAACTRPRTKAQRTFCAAIATDQTKLDSLATQLTAAPVVRPNPEVTALAGVTGWSFDQITFTAALFPAVLVELVAGLGLFALRQRINPKPTHSLTSSRVRHWLPKPGSATETPSVAALEAPSTGINPAPTPRPFKLKLQPPSKVVP